MNDVFRCSESSDLIKDRRGAARGPVAHEAARPQPGGHRDGRKEPRRSALAADERVELVRLKLTHLEVPHDVPVAMRGRARGPVEPSGNRVLGTTRDASRRRDAHALDSQARHLVEFPPTAAKPTVRRARIQADRASADRAVVPRPSARLRRQPAVVHDVEARLSKILTRGPEARDVVDRPHRSSVVARTTTVSPMSRTLRATDQQRPAQAPTHQPANEFCIY